VSRSPGLFDGALSAPGTLNLLGMCFVFGALAITYDIVFGYVGLLSFGHALYFATGVYVTAIALARWHWSLPAALASDRGGVARAAAGARRDLPAHARHSVRDGDAGLRASRLDPGDAEPVRPDRRRGRVWRSAATCCRRLWSASSTRATCTGSRSC
jgi:hypothetical protein